MFSFRWLLSAHVERRHVLRGHERERQGAAGAANTQSQLRHQHSTVHHSRDSFKLLRQTGKPGLCCSSFYSDRETFDISICQKCLYLGPWLWGPDCLKSTFVLLWICKTLKSHSTVFLTCFFGFLEKITGLVQQKNQEIKHKCSEMEQKLLSD